jgi:hypothetical protein
MIDDLLTYLTAEEVERLTDRSTSRSDSDYRSHALAARLSGETMRQSAERLSCSPDEWRVLTRYLGADVQDLDGISADAHSWLLERLCLFPEVILETGIVRLIDLYFLKDSPSIKTLVVLAILASEQRSAGERPEERESGLRQLCLRILDDGGITVEQQADAIAALVDLLVDLLILTQGSTAENALRDLMHSIETSRFDNRSVSDRLLARADELGGEFAIRLRRITS